VIIFLPRLWQLALGVISVYAPVFEVMGNLT
jgi:hypothetical protein